MIAIIDYNAGNLQSVKNAFSYLGYESVITSGRDEILRADAAILPGVGAFSDAKHQLCSLGLDEVVKELVLQNRYVLGICVGLQLLFDKSFEGGEHSGLGILPGEIKKIPDDNGCKVPQIGWNHLHITGDCPLFEGLKDRYVYFVHSYYLNSFDKHLVTATVSYGVQIDAAVQKGNLFATQFHPEKSGEAGLKILSNFAKTAGLTKKVKGTGL